MVQTDFARRTRRMLNGTVQALTLTGCMVWGASAAAQAPAPIAPPASPEAGPAEPAAAEPGAATRAQNAERDEIVVTGSRIARSGFSTPTPVTVLGVDRLEKLGITNVGEALSQLPSFRGTTSPTSTAPGSNISPVNAGARIADLRGLGPSRTLVLVDGRRFVPSTTLGTVDLNLIPTLLIERAEVVTGGASAAYGSDAVSGVVNIILNKKLEGIRASAQYGQTDVGDGKDYVAQFAAGTSFDGGRGHFVFGAEYEKDRGTGGCYTRDFCGNEVADVTGVPGASGRPAHNIETGVHTTSATPGGIIVATYNAAGVRTAVSPTGPLGGIQFADNGTPTAFTYGLYRNALFQVGGTGAGLNTFFGDPLLSIPVTRYNGYAHFEYEVSDAFTGFLEASYGHGAGYPRGPEIRDTTGDRINIDNPFLPASTKALMMANGVAAIGVGKLGTDFGTIDSQSTRDTYRVVGGASGRFGGSWKWDAYAQYGVTDYHQTTINDRITANFNKAIDAVMGPNGAPVCRVNADAIKTNDDPACVALNILGQGQFSAAAKAYAFGTTHQSTEIEQDVVAANVQGNLFEGWAGAIPVAAGVELRRDKLQINVDPISAANGFYVYNSSNSAGQVKVSEGYIETTLPLLKDSALGKRLELNGAVRRTHYKTTSVAASNTFNATTWKVGVAYRPVDVLLLRATESQDIRAPNSVELFTAPVGGQLAINDTKTNTQNFAQTLTGGNVNLEPEKARTFTVGATLQPTGELLGGLRLSVDYYKIKIKRAIATLGAQVIVDTCNTTGAADICALVQRNPAGLIQTVSVLYLNLNQLTENGIDVEGSYHMPLSRIGISGDSALDLRVLATRTIHLKNSSLPGIDRAGDDGVNGVPSWIVDGLATLTLGRFSLTAQEHYISPGKVDATYVGPEDPGYSILLSNSINTNRVPARFYTTLGASYDIIKSGDRRVQVYGAVVNVFDKDPPARFNGNNNTVYYDPLGRRYRVGIRVTY